MLEVEALQHLVDDLFLVGRVVGSAVLPAVHIGCGSGETLSCWVRMVAEARDENRDTRQGCSTGSVPSLVSNRNVGKATWFSGLSVRPLPGACVLVSWLCGRPWPLAFCSGSVCLSGLVVCSWPCCVVWFRLRVSFKKRLRPRAPTQRPGFFPDRPTTCRAGSPWWPGVRGDDPRTDLLAGTPFYVRHYSGIGGGCWVLTLVFLVASSFFVFSSSARLFRPTGGGGGRSSTCRAGCSSFLPFLLLLFRKVTHERRRFPWRLVWAISFVQASETIFVRFLNSPVERDTVPALYRMQCKDISTRRRQKLRLRSQWFWCSCCRHWFPLFCRQRRRPL